MLRSELICKVSETNNWFNYIVRVSPHHTDYAGVVWHGTYIAWMEEARIEQLRLTGLDYHKLVEIGCELPVVELAIRYHQAVQMGMEIVVKNRIMPIQGVRIPWEYRIESLDGQSHYLSAQVTLVPVDRQTGKIQRRLPSLLQDAIAQLLPVAE